jgi:hypothetical protein
MSKSFYEKHEIEDIIKESRSVYEALLKTQRYGGWANRKFRQSIIYHNIDISHFETPSQRARRLFSDGKSRKAIDMSEVLVENSSYSRCALKNRLYREGLKTKLCELCGQGEDWHGKHMSLILDHINGVYNDNRIENLRIVCPNCNATLDTHGGKNRKKNIAISNIPNLPKQRPSKINWPDPEEMKRLVWSMPRTELSKLLKVSDVAISKHCERLSIERPGKGYFSRIENRNYIGSM